MKEYEAPSYEVEYFRIRNEIFTGSENPDNNFDEGYPDDMGPGVY